MGRWNWILSYNPFRRLRIDGAKPLDVATSNSYLEICKLIIESISDKNPSGPMGFTTLHVAAESGQFEICKLIMESLQDKNPEDQMGQTPLHFFARHGHLEICELVIQSLDDKNPQCHDDGDTPLHEAARGGHLEVCRVIMENAANINPINAYRQMPIHESVRSGNVQLCKLMLDNCGDVLSTFSTNYIPMDVTIKDSMVRIAYEKGDLDMCKLLVDNEENFKLNPITRTFFMTSMMCLYTFGGGFWPTWPKHSWAAFFLISLMYITLIIPFVPFLEILRSNIVHESSGLIILMLFWLIAIISCALYAMLIVTTLQSCVKRMKGL